MKVGTTATVMYIYVQISEVLLKKYTRKTLKLFYN